MPLAGVPLRPDCPQPEPPHQPPHASAADRDPIPQQRDLQPAAAVDRIVGENPVEPLQKLEFRRRFRPRPVMEAAARNPRAARIAGLRTAPPPAREARMGVPAPSGRRHRTEAQPWRVLRLVESRGVRIRRSAGEHRTRLISANRRRRRHWPPDAMPSRCREFVDSRLRRSPPAAPRGPLWTSRGKRHAFPPPCPQVGGCPQASQHPQQDRMNLISGKGETSSRLPAFSLFLPGTCPNTRDRRTYGPVGDW